MTTPLLELQEKVLDFLLRYRTEWEPGLKFVLRKSNIGGALEAGRWFLDGKDYLALNFWNGPYYLAFRMYEDGASALYETRALKINAAQKKALSRVIANPDRSDPNYRVKSFSATGEDGLVGLKKFLETDRKVIDEAVRQHPMQGQDFEEEQKGLSFIDDTEFEITLKTIAEFRQRRTAQQTVFPALKPSKPTAGQPSIAVESFLLRNFQGIKKTEVLSLPRANWIFLTGNNGYGKTSVLRGLFISLFGQQDGDVLRTDDRANLSVRYWDNERVQTSINTKTNGPLRFLAAYGSSRLNIMGSDSREEEGEKNKPSYSIFRTDGVLRSIENRLRYWYNEDKPRYQAVISTLKNLMPGIAEMFYDPAADKVFYQEQAAETSERLDFERLASGFRSVIAMVGDLIVRFFEKDPLLQKPEDCTGIVLIDELDLHLHPIWQRQLPGLLSKAFPKMQFIASTHSPIPFLGAPKDAVFLRVNRSPEEGITVEHLEIDVSDLLPNTILTSPIFGLQEIYPTAFDGKKQRIRTEETFTEVQLNDHVRQRLTAFANSDQENALLDVFKPKAS